LEQVKKLILGTVQFGLNYGIDNNNGKVKEDEVFEILKKAHIYGIRVLDTADAYGNAAELIGAFHRRSKIEFEIITKFKSEYNRLENLEDRIDITLEKLSVNSIFGYLYHSFDDFKKHIDVLEQLISLQEKKKIKHIGVSLYTNEELEDVLEEEYIKIIQLPYNLLDNKNKRGELLRIAKGKGKIIHTRSVFLQGLFFKDVEKLPYALNPLKNDLIKIQQLASNEAEKIAHLSLNYALSNQDIDGVLIGVDNIDQLNQNIKMANKKLSPKVTQEVNKIEVENISLLNPSNWS